MCTNGVARMLLYLRISKERFLKRSFVNCVIFKMSITLKGKNLLHGGSEFFSFNSSPSRGELIPLIVVVVSYCCHVVVSVMRLFLAVPWVGL